MFLGTLSLSSWQSKLSHRPFPPPPHLPAHDSYMYPHLFDPDDWG